MYLSYITSFYYSNIILLFFIKENDYRQGLDYNILNLHLHSILLTYFFFILLIILYISDLIGMNSSKWVYIINKISLYSATSLIVSGGFWSWSQWGAIQLYDIKVLITITIILVFFTVNIVLKISKKLNNILLFYNIYILYHIPLLKYNVVWNSEIHQKSTFHLIDFFMVNYSTIFFIMTLLITMTIHISTIDLYKRKLRVLNMVI